VSISKEIKLTEAVSNNNSIQKPEQKIEAVKWEKIKLVELIQQAKQLGVYTPEDDKANKVKLKWELIRRIKKKLAEV
jgi:hypothetical protein